MYARVSETEVHLSLSVGSACGLHQTHSSQFYNQSAQLALSLKLRERLREFLVIGDVVLSGRLHDRYAYVCDS